MNAQLKKHQQQPMNIIVFVSGHLDVTPDEFNTHYIPKIQSAVERGAHFIVGDARGADFLFQQYAAKNNLNVTVFHMFQSPRNNAGSSPTKGGFASDEERDTAMTHSSTEDIAWIRPGREKSGTAKNLARRHT
jgi:hypothetical protein